MKNSTLINIVVFGGIIGWLLYLFTFVMTIILIVLIIVALLFYIITCIIEYGNGYEDLIPDEYNIFVKISEFYEWIDSKPKIIKPTKKNWRAPEDWEGDI